MDNFPFRRLCGFLLSIQQNKQEWKLVLSLCAEPFISVRSHFRPSSCERQHADWNVSIQRRLLRAMMAGQARGPGLRRVQSDGGKGRRDQRNVRDVVQAVPLAE